MKLFNCICCGSDDYKTLPYNNKGYAVLKKQDNIFAGLKILSCNSCGFSNTYPLLDEEKIVNFYKKSYSKPGTIHAVGWEQRFMNYRKELSSRAVAHVNLIKTFKDILNIHDILEIGPGDGSVKKYFDVSGKNINYYVFEEDETKFQLLKKLNANFISNESGNFFKEELANKFDLTIMSHALEHFQNNKILNIVNDVYKMTSDNGVFLIEVPSVDFRKDSLEENHSPHLSFFSQDALRNLLEKTDFQIAFMCEVGSQKQKTRNNNTFSKLKECLKDYYLLMTIYRSLKSIQNLTKILFYNIYYTFFSNAIDHIKSDFFDYGSNRDSIRCLLVKKHK